MHLRAIGFPLPPPPPADEDSDEGGGVLGLALIRLEDPSCESAVPVSRMIDLDAPRPQDTGH